MRIFVQNVFSPSKCGLEDTLGMVKSNIPDNSLKNRTKVESRADTRTNDSVDSRGRVQVLYGLHEPHKRKLLVPPQYLTFGLNVPMI